MAAVDFTVSSTKPVPSTTESNPFFSCAPNGQKLFTVREGLPALHALEQVSTFLAAAKDAATLAACEADGNAAGTMWTSVYIIELAKATLDATTPGMYRESRKTAVQALEAPAAEPLDDPWRRAESVMHDALSALGKVRRLIQEGKPDEAARIADDAESELVGEVFNFEEIYQALKVPATPSGNTPSTP